MIKLRLLLILVTSVLFTGCASKLLRPDGVSPSSLTTENGTLVGTFARNPNERAYYSQTFYFKNIKTGEKKEIKSQQTFNIFNGKTADDFTTTTSVGGIFIFSLPAGQYTFTNFRLYQSQGYSYQNWFAKEDFSIPFEVKAGATNYVGEIRLEQMKGKNFFGMTVQAGGIWFISDQQTRDIGLIKEIRLDIPVDQVVSVVPKIKEKFTPLVVLSGEEEEYLQNQQK